MSLISEMIQIKNKLPIYQLTLMPRSTSTNEFCEFDISNVLIGVG